MSRAALGPLTRRDLSGRIAHVVLVCVSVGPIRVRAPSGGWCGFFSTCAWLVACMSCGRARGRAPAVGAVGCRVGEF